MAFEVGSDQIIGRQSIPLTEPVAIQCRIQPGDINGRLIAYIEAGSREMPRAVFVEEAPQLVVRDLVGSQIKSFVESDVTRKFILTNLTRNKDGVYRWRLNMDAIQRNYENLRARLEWSTAFTKPVLFVKGALSNYIHSKHEKEILEIFPAASVKIIMEAGHWLHAERPQVFQKIVTDFLLQDESSAGEA